MIMLYGQEERLIPWVLARLPYMTVTPHAVAIGTVTDGGSGVVVYDNYRQIDIEMTVVGQGDWLSRTSLNAFFHYPFVQLQCQRVTAITDKKNKHARAFVEKVGFVLEGVARRGMFSGNDAIIYGMLPEECRWIKEDANAHSSASGRAA